MLSKSWLRYVWCGFVGGVIVLSAFPGRGWMNIATISFGSSRWGHFLVYLVIAVIPIIIWRWRVGILVCFAIAFLGYSTEMLRGLIPGFIGSPENAIANIFGVSAGILLGINIRMTLGAGMDSNEPSMGRNSDTVKWLQGSDTTTSETEG